MRKIKSINQKWVSPIINFSRIYNVLPNYLEYFRKWKLYSKMEGAEPLKLRNAQPSLFDKTLTTGIDSHYFYQDLWAFKKIFNSPFEYHTDIGSKVDFVGFISAIKKVTFIDIRYLDVNLENFQSEKGNILALRFKDNSISSLSCLHVAEHIGLGRYGDDLDPMGTRKAAKELSRVLDPTGNLFFSVPIGKPRLCYNSHRIHSVKQILDYFPELELVELSGVNDEGEFIKNIKRSTLDSCVYGCGFFWFTKEGK